MRLWSHACPTDDGRQAIRSRRSPRGAVKFTEDPEDKSKRPMMSKEALMKLLYGDSTKLRELCKQLTDALRQQIRAPEPSLSRRCESRRAHR